MGPATCRAFRMHGGDHMTVEITTRPTIREIEPTASGWRQIEATGHTVQVTVTC